MTATDVAGSVERAGSAPTRVRQVRAFDFRRPTILSREHVRSVQIVHETLARGFTTTLSSALRAAISVSIHDIDQRSYDEYVQSLPNPTLLTSLSLEPLDGAALLQIPSRSAFMATELLLGGRGGPDQPRRTMTDLELALMRGIVELLLPDVTRAFEPITPVEPGIVNLETNPQFAQLTAPTDMVIVVSFDLTIENVTDVMTLCIPFATLQGRLEAMSARSRISSQSAEKLAHEHDMLHARTSGAVVTNAATFRPVVASSRELNSIHVGDVLLLNHPTSMPLTLSVNGVGTHEVRIGRVNRQYAVQIVGEASADAFRNPARLHVLRSDAAS